MKIHCRVLSTTFCLAGTFALLSIQSAWAADLRSINALKSLENQKWGRTFSFDQPSMEDVGVGGGGTGTGSGGGTGTGGGGKRKAIVWDPNGDWRWNDSKSILNEKNWFQEELAQ